MESAGMMKIIHGESPEALAELADDSVDACVTDPPYHLTAGKKGGSGPASVNLESPYGRARITTGFMGKSWDGGDVAFRPETWREVLRVLKPGAHLLAFGGSRTYHRMACAVEDAGFEVRDQIMWLYGSGFPKSLNLDGEWDGWGTALKPAHEPILMARKPLIGTVEENINQFRTGALNVDGCRVPGGDGAGRWPANVIHDGSEEVVMAFPDAPGQIGVVGPQFGDKESINVYGDFGPRGHMAPRGDGGSAARFFYCAKATKADRDDGLSGFTQVNAGIKNESGRGYSERDAYAEVLRANSHPTVKPTELMRYLCRLVTPRGGVVLDPFMGSGSTGRGALLGDFQFIGIEREAEYVELARARIRAISPLFVGATS